MFLILSTFNKILLINDANSGPFSSIFSLNLGSKILQTNNELINTKEKY